LKAVGTPQKIAIFAELNTEYINQIYYVGEKFDQDLRAELSQ
jgi:hypothetical protein